MKSGIRIFLAAILTIQFSATTSYAREVGPEVCGNCVSDDKSVGDIVTWDGQDWRLDRVSIEHGRKMWDAHVVDTAGSAVGEGKSFGNETKEFNHERITGRDFASFEDSKEYSKEKRQKLHEIQQKIITRLNSESVADSDATYKELQGQVGTLNESVSAAGQISYQGAAVLQEAIDPMASLYDSLQAQMGNENFYIDQAGWQLVDNHAYQSVHKDELDKLRDRLNYSVPKSPQQADAKRVGYYVLDQTDKAYSANQPQLGDGLFEIAKVVVDIATDIIPITSIPKDLYRAVVGKDPMTGEVLEGWERALAGGFAVAGIFGLGAVKVGVSRIRAMARAARVAEKDLALAARVAKSAEGALPVRSAVARLKDGLRDVKLLNPVDENNFLTKVFKYSNKAWDERKIILQGKTKSDQKLVRFFSKDGSEVGNWATPMEQVVGKTPEEIRLILALKHAPSSFTIVDIPAGTEVVVGFISPNEWGGKNGAIQYFLPTFKNKFFGPAKPINNMFRGL